MTAGLLWTRQPISEDARELVAEAVAALEAAVAAFPSRPEGHFYLARGRSLLGDDRKALSALDAALAAEPRFAPARLLRQDLAGGGALEAEVADAPGAAWVHAYQALREKRWEEAVRAYHDLDSIAAAGGEPFLGAAIEVRLGRGLASLALKDYEAAKRDFIAATALWSDYLEPEFLLGKTYELEGKAPEAERTFERLHGRSPQGDQTAARVARFFAAQRKYDEALRWAARLARVESRAALLLSLNLTAGRIEAAVDAGRLAVAVDRGNARAHIDLGTALLQDLWRRGHWGSDGPGTPAERTLRRSSMPQRELSSSTRKAPPPGGSGPRCRWREARSRRPRTTSTAPPRRAAPAPHDHHPPTTRKPT